MPAAYVVALPHPLGPQRSAQCAVRMIIGRDALAGYEALAVSAGVNTPTWSARFGAGAHAKSAARSAPYFLSVPSGLTGMVPLGPMPLICTITSSFFAPS